MGAFVAKLLKDLKAGNLRQRLVAALKAYLVFAGVHGFIKAFHFISFTYRARKSLRAFPGYPMDWLGKDILKNFLRMHDWRKDFILKHHDADFIRGPGPGADLICVSEDAVKFILKDKFNHFTKIHPAKFYLTQVVADFIGGDGIFVVRHGTQPELAKENALWLSQRKTASKLFTKNNFDKFMRETFVTKCDRMVEVVGHVADKQDKMDFQKMFFSFTMDSIQKIFFSRDVDTVGGEMDLFANAYDQAHHNMMAFMYRNIPLVTASTMLFPFPFGTIFNDYRTNLLLTFIRKMDPCGREFDKHRKYLSDRTYEFVRQARQDKNLQKRNDLLSFFLRQGDKLSDKELHDIILNFIIAGRDTTACTLTWLFFELTQNLDVQERLIEEIDRVLDGRCPTIDDLEPSNMPYLNGVLYETLRLHPPVPEDLKECTEDVVYKGVRIMKGTRLHFVPYTMGRDPHRYPNVEAFDPERWIPFEEPSMFAMPTFQAGPRFCLGKDMAKLEAKLVVVKLLQNFRFKLLPGEAENISYSLMITLSLVNNKEKTSSNLWILPERRQIST